jgi:dTDP-4-dehydrorhamnose 3,5-epimerase
MELLHGMHQVYIPAKASMQGGSIYPVLSSNEPGFDGFGELYFSSIPPGVTKGWIKHTRMIMNLVVPFGEIDMYFVDDRAQSSTYQKKLQVKMSQANPARLTLPPEIWFAFRCRGEIESTLMNVSNILHDPAEFVRADLTRWPLEDFES